DLRGLGLAPAFRQPGGARVDPVLGADPLEGRAVGGLVVHLEHLGDVLVRELVPQHLDDLAPRPLDREAPPDLDRPLRRDPAPEHLRVGQAEGGRPEPGEVRAALLVTQRVEERRVELRGPDLPRHRRRMGARPRLGHSRSGSVVLVRAWLAAVLVLSLASTASAQASVCTELDDDDVRARTAILEDAIAREEPAVRRWWTSFALLHAVMASGAAILAASAQDEGFRNEMIM